MYQAPSSKLRTPFRALIAFTASVVAVAGCGEATGVKAQFSNIETKPTVYAFNSAPVVLPAALVVRAASVVRIDATFLFDLAFDLDASGVTQVYASSRVASELAGTHRVGMQLRDDAFSSITEAPNGGYVYDTVMALPVGKTLLVDVLEQGCSNSFLGANIKAKVSVDSVNTTSRAIFLHVLSDPNCGFRELIQGEPKK